MIMKHLQCEHVLYLHSILIDIRNLIPEMFAVVLPHIMLIQSEQKRLNKINFNSAHPGNSKADHYVLGAQCNKKSISRSIHCEEKHTSSA